MPDKFRVYSQIEGLFTDIKGKPGPVDFNKYPVFEICGFKISQFMTLYESLSKFPYILFSNDLLTRNFGMTSYIAVKEISEEIRVIPPVEARNELEALITCLRLFKEGFVNWGLSFAIGIEEELQGNPHGMMFGATLQDAGGGMAYLLKEEEIDELISYSNEIFPHILSLEKDQGELMLKYFNRAINDRVRWDFKSAIVDYFISIDAISKLVRSETTKDHFRNLVAISVHDPSNRKSAYNKLWRLKNKRNQIVHGVHKKYDSNALQNNCIYLEDLIRKAIRHILSYYVSGRNAEDLSNEIDLEKLGNVTD